MRKIINLTLLLLCSFISTAQTPGIVSLQRFGGNADDYFNAIIKLKNGNYVAAGYGLSIDNHLAGNKGMSDFFILCMSPGGQVLWKKLLGGSKTDGVNFHNCNESLSATSDGGFFFTGVTESDDGDIINAKGGMDIFVARFDADGNVLWKNNYGGIGNESVYSVESTPDGGCVFAGTTYSNNSGDVPANKATEYFADVWIVKLNASGAISWSKTYGGSATDGGAGIRNTSDGGYIFTADIASVDGDLAGTVAVGASRKTDIWVVKINSTGTISWHKRIGGSDDDDNARILVSSTGDYFISAGSRSADGDIPGNFGIYDVIFIKLDASGNIKFITNHGSGGWDIGADLVELSDGNILIGGTTYSVNFNGLPIPILGDCEVIVCKMDKNTGVLKSLKAFGGNDRDFIKGICLSADEEAVVAGYSRSNNYDFPGGFGAYDAFLAKIVPGNVVKGYVYYDNNNNNTKDNNEPFVENTQVITTNVKGHTVSTHTLDGTYANYVDTGTFKTFVRLLKPGYFTVKPDTITSVFDDQYGSVTRNIALVPVADKRDLQVMIVGMGAARAGFVTSYKLICFNSGTVTIPTGTIKFIKEHKSVLNSALPQQSNLNGDTITWRFSNLKSLDTLSFNIDIELFRPPFIEINDWIVLKAFAYPIQGDITPSDNIYTLHHLVTGSYDPNDKNESHGGIYTTANLASRDYLNYTIRFQNTGNDTAFTVVVKDTLSSKLDVNSLQLLSTSHKMNFNIEDNILTWTFNKIDLPDSNRNEPLSHGYILYRIKPAATTKVNDVIANSASIYFDFNPPIITNTHITLIKPQLVPPMPVFEPVKDVCINDPYQRIKVMNIPGIEYQAVVEAKINELPVQVNADSVLLIDPMILGGGQYELTITYLNESDTSSVSDVFQVFASISPGVDLIANPAIVNAGSAADIQLNAIKRMGDGNVFTYVFAKDRMFNDIIRAESTANTFTINSRELKNGDNVFYVKIKTDEKCLLNSSAIDSVVVKLNSSVSSAPGIRISANPYKTEFTVNGINPSVITYLRVVDLNGRTLLATTTRGRESVTINGANFPGLIFLAIINDHKNQVKMIPLLKQ